MAKTVIDQRYLNKEDLTLENLQCEIEIARETDSFQQKCKKLQTLTANLQQQVQKLEGVQCQTNTKSY